MTSSTEITCTTLSSPWGPLLLASSEDAVVGLWREGQQHFPSELPGPRRASTPFKQPAEEQLNEYFEGARQVFDLPLQPLGGTPFQRKVWQGLLSIPYGQTSTYQQMATTIQSPTSTRAVASAIGRNPLLILIPCHRVIGSDGALRGFAAGLPMKQQLLCLEIEHA